MGTAPNFAYDGYGYLARIGLIYMHSSVVMEDEMWAMAAPGISIHTARIHLPKATLEGIGSMMDSPKLEEAARLVSGAPIDVLCFGGTSASFLYGTKWDQALIAKMVEWAPNVPVTTASTATLAGLAEVGAGKVALATPYVDEVHERAVRFLEENGHTVVKSSNLGISEDHALAEVPLDRIYDLVCSVDHSEATAFFVSCTNFRSAAVIAALEETLGRPVISAVQASFWHSLVLAGVKGAQPGYGRLMEACLATAAARGGADLQGVGHAAN